MKKAITAIAIALLLISGCSNSSNGSSELKRNHKMHKYTNQLVNEKSPYLQQHAHNPVNWYPWSDDAFEKARKENKPIFLSIGYATCHWCHVMEHESFEDEEVAALMNDAFISIKVDREERPDIDNVYMTVCQLLTRSGGWPLTIIMTPDKKPFFAGTYIPKNGRFGRAGMLDIIPKIKKMWNTDRQSLVKSAEKISKHLKAAMTAGNGIKGNITETLFKEAFQELEKSFDSSNGGFGGHPKFPIPHKLIFLLRYWQRTGEPKALAMVEFTLQKMRQNGIFDHLGHGFHRYSTDSQWLLPHFEKMLYDQALLVMAYVEAYSATKNSIYKETADEILAYILRDMTSPTGGYYSAEDADSEGVEGKFYVWEYSQLKKHLTPDEFKLFEQYYDIHKNGNFQDEATGNATGNNIIHLKKYPINNPEDKSKLALIRKKLFNIRKTRIHPLKDTKILTDWNGLMITAMAKAGRYLNNQTYIKAATKAADFILDTMRNSKGDLQHRYKDGDIKIAGMLDDYAFFIQGLLELYEATFDASYLKEANTLSTIMIDHFGDDKNGGFFLTADQAETLLVRPKEIYDGAIPSGNSVAFQVLLKLSLITGNVTLEEVAENLEQEVADQVQRSPGNFAQFLSAAMLAAGPSYEIVISGNQADSSTKAFIDEVFLPYLPEKVVVFRPNKENTLISSLAPYTKTQTMLDGNPTVYICKNRHCQKPETTLPGLKEALKLLKSE